MMILDFVPCKGETFKVQGIASRCPHLKSDYKDCHVNDKRSSKGYSSKRKLPSVGHT